ncbi:MAG: histidine kinase [Clostridiales bacterium]|jgi:sensor histidine kinase YesM|nr:histidine kinase [Clostridiales bacterium]
MGAFKAIRAWAAGLAYRKKLVLIFMLASLAPLTMFYAFFSVHAYDSYKGELLEEARAPLASGAEELNGVYLGYMQKLDLLYKNYQVQNILASKSPIRMSTAVFDSYYALSSLYKALEEPAFSWQLTMYTPNPNVLQGAFIESMDRMEPSLRAKALELGDGADGVDGGGGGSGYSWDYIYSHEKRADALYLLQRNFALDSRLYAVGQIRIAFDRVRASFGSRFPEGTRVLYFVGGALAVDLLAPPDLGVAEAESFLAGELGGYYAATATIYANMDYVAAYVPKSRLSAQLARPLALLTGGYAALIGMFSLLTALISNLLTKRLYGLIGEINRDIPKLIGAGGMTEYGGSVPESGGGMTEYGGSVPESGGMPAYGGSDEFAGISRRFAELVREIRDRCGEMAVIEADRKSLELELLQSLINPHFLYNTLDGIKWTCRDARLAEVIDGMISYYRIALNRGNAILPVAQEMEMARLYLEIQRFAYESDFQYGVEVGEGLGRCLMLKNIVQPVVENAFMHGIKRRPSDRIDVRAARSGDFVIFTVADNGCGMTEEKAGRVMAGTHGGIKSGGYGLYNVMSRIRLYYGGDCGLSISGGPGAGTVVTLRVRYLEEEPGRPGAPEERQALGHYSPAKNFLTRSSNSSGEKAQG